MSNKTITDYTSASGIDPVNDYLLIESLNVYYKINRNTIMGITGTPADISSSQTFSNKNIGNTNSITIKDGSFTLQNSSSITKQAVFSLSSITTGQTRIITVPDSSLTLVGTATTQTLTNKTITGAAISGGTIDNSTITVDSIGGHTSPTIVTVANLQISNGVLNSANAVTAVSIAAGAVQPQALVAGTGSGWTWQTWTPTFTNWSVGTGGSAGTVAAYTQTGKTVFFRLISFIGSSGGSVGTNPTFTLPVATSSGFGNTFPMGLIRMGVAGSIYLGYIYNTSTTVAGMFTIGTGGSTASESSISSTVPNTWAPGNFITITGSYEAA